MTTPAVYAAIAKVQGELAKVGIAKARKNAQQGYSFRGIDDVYAALSPMLADAGLCIVPRVISRETDARTTKSGGVLYFVTVHAEFDFVAVSDGSKHTASTYGEASDSGDKATNKAMSAAYKYAAFMTFAIPTEGDNDADAHTPEPTVTEDWAAFAVEFRDILDRCETTDAIDRLWTGRSKRLNAMKAEAPPIYAAMIAAGKARKLALSNNETAQKEAAE